MPTSRRGVVTVGRGLTVAAACAALFGASFAAGNALLDGDEDRSQVRPTRSAPPVESAPPADRARLALALGRAADLPGLRTPPESTPPQRTTGRQVPPWSAAAGPSGDSSDGAAQSVDSTPPAPASPAPTQPVSNPPPSQQWSPPSPPPPPSTSSQPSTVTPRPDAPPSPPQPAPDPAPSGGAQFGVDGDR